MQLIFFVILSASILWTGFGLVREHDEACGDRRIRGRRDAVLGLAGDRYLRCCDVVEMMRIERPR
jgi:hypothetical protein